MYYKKTEEYRFSMPQEHSACLAFKDRLRELGIKFIDEGGFSEATISVVTRGCFDVGNECDILALTKE